MVSEPPSVSLRTSEASAVDARLLSSSDSDRSSVVSVADRVRLSVFESSSGDDEIGQGGGRELWQ